MEHEKDAEDDSKWPTATRKGRRSRQRKRSDEDSGRSTPAIIPSGGGTPSGCHAAAPLPME
eukprot:5314553-Pyramimonas_sp.AAC.1